MSFEARRIQAPDTIGEKLQRGRQALSLSVGQVADTTRINSRFIQALEQGRYKDLPGSVYVRKYVSELCRVYHLSYADLEKQLAHEVGLTQPKVVKLSPKASNKPLWIPNLFRWGVVGVMIAVIGAYFTWQVVRLVTPPQLEVIQPAQDIVLDQPTIMVVGQTQPGVQVTINGEAANVDQTGRFEEQVALRPGLNRLEIQAKSKYSSASQVVRQIVVEKPK